MGVTVMTSERLVPLRPSADVLTALCVFVAAEKFVLFHKERCCCSTFACVLLFVHRRVVVKVFVQEGVCLVTVVVEVRRWKPVFLLQVKYSCLSSLTACRAFRTDGSEPSAALKPRPDGPEVSFHAHLPASRAQTFMLEGFYPAPVEAAASRVTSMVSSPLRETPLIFLSLCMFVLPLRSAELMFDSLCMKPEPWLHLWGV